MIIPCIDLMNGKAVQLVQGRDKALEIDDPLEMLGKFAAFREVQVIDLDAAMNRGSNDDMVRQLASRVAARVGGGVRSTERAQTLVEQGAQKVIVGTAAFASNGVNHEFLKRAADAIGDLLDLFLARGIDRLSLVGGLSDAITPWLTPDLRARLKRPDADAVAGALLVARGRVLPKSEAKTEADNEPAPKFRV